MKNRIFGLLAILIGGLAAAALIVEPQKAEAKFVVIVCVFIGIGAWQLFTGKGLASISDFIFKGKISADKVDQTKPK